MANMKRWEALLRTAGIVGFLLAYGIFTVYGTSSYAFALVIASIGTLVMPEFVHELPIGPQK